MKKNYFLIIAILFGWFSSVQAVDVTVQVDLNGVPDYYAGGSVWIMLDNTWTEYYDMTDADEDGIWEYIVTQDVGTDLYFKFGYQTGPDPWTEYVEETVPTECAEDNGLRMVVVPETNVTLPAVSYESCFEAGITIRVDLSERTDLYEGGAVWVYMDDDWFEYYDMLGGVDDIYYYTLQKDAGTTMQYSFSYQTGPDPNYDYVVETVPPECANANGYRELLVPTGDTTLPKFLYGSCSEASGAVVPTYTITFRVDMRELPLIDLYEGGSVWLNINDWTEYYDMTDDDSDDIYTYDYVADSGSTILYKYSYQSGPDPDYDYTDEAVPAECASALSEWDREHVVTQDMILPAYLLGSCGVYGDPGTEKVMVTFSVELGGDSVLTNGMWMVTKSPWSWREQMHTTGDVYESTVRLFKDQTIPYTFVYGGKDNWDGEESVPPACNYGTETAPERLFEGAQADSVMPVIPFGQCLGSKNVTFRVNMKNVSMNVGDTVWMIVNPGGAWMVMSNDDEDDIYELTLPQVPGTEVFYRYSYGTSAIWDEEIVPAECAFDFEGTDHRKVVVADEDEVLPDYLYGSCEVGSAGIAELYENFNVYPNPANSFLTLELLKDHQSIEIDLLDISGRRISSNQFDGQKIITLPVKDLATGIYLLQINTENGMYNNKVLIEN